MVLSMQFLGRVNQPEIRNLFICDFLKSTHCHTDLRPFVSFCHPEAG